MYRFWKVIIEPVLEIIKPKNIVEIGSDYGTNTKKLINFCQQNDAILHVIDPLPKFDIDEWKKDYPEQVIFYKELSLNVLWKLKDIDLVLIDGDHNWYTVFNELKMLKKSAEKADRHFPLVMLHDIGWPYGRRDLYYDPKTIPIAYRKPYKRSGMLLGRSTLAEQGGLNAYFNNALYENNQQNGVLTAVEDFLEENAQSLQFIKIPGLYGLGVIFPNELLQLNPAFAVWSRELTAPSVAWAISEEIEKARIQTETVRQELEDRLASRETELQMAKEAFQKTLRAKERVEAAAQEERERLQAEVEAQRRLVREHCKAAQTLTETARVRTDEVYTLSRWMRQIQNNIEAILESWRWKVGDRVVRSAELALFRRRVPMATDHLQSLFKNYDDWVRQHRPLVQQLPYQHSEKKVTITNKELQVSTEPERRRPIDLDMAELVRAGKAECNICGSKKFGPVENRLVAKCTQCGSRERTRVIKLFMDTLDLLKPGMKVLHLAPEVGLAKYIYSVVGNGYCGADLDVERFKKNGIPNMRAIDLCHSLANFGKGTFDLVLHSHVLEHVPCNWTVSLKNLNDLLKSGGYHLCCIPFMGGHYDESLAPISKEEATRRFGQFDHVRRFGAKDRYLTLGMVVPLPENYDLTKDYSEALLRKYNIPQRTWKGYTPETILVWKKEDFLL